jgi:hypothetical protein
MAVVQIIGVIAVRHGRMPAIRAVSMAMIFMGCMIHDIFLTFVFNDDTNILQRHEHLKKTPDNPVNALLEDVHQRPAGKYSSLGNHSPASFLYIGQMLDFREAVLRENIQARLH